MDFTSYQTQRRCRDANSHVYDHGDDDDVERFLRMKDHETVTRREQAQRKVLLEWLFRVCVCVCVCVNTVCVGFRHLFSWLKTGRHESRTAQESLHRACHVWRVCIEHVMFGEFA
jgi:hypothetical protein